MTGVSFDERRRRSRRRQRLFDSLLKAAGFATNVKPCEEAFVPTGWSLRLGAPNEKEKVPKPLVLPKSGPLPPSVAPNEKRVPLSEAAPPPPKTMVGLDSGLRKVVFDGDAIEFAPRAGTSIQSRTRTKRSESKRVHYLVVQQQLSPVVFALSFPL